MSIADKLKDVIRTSPGLPCGIAKILASVSKEDRDALNIVFSTKSVQGTISNIQLHELLMSEGYNVAFSSVRLHRGQRCRCYIGTEARHPSDKKAKK
jgi:hypothetical protein